MTTGTLAMVYRFPEIWPPIEDKELFQKIENNNCIKVIADTKGRFNILINSSQPNNENVFQPIRIQGNGDCIITITWSASKISFRINGRQVELDNKARGKTFNLITQNTPQPVHTKMIGDIAIPKSTSKEEQLFLNTLMDIENKTFSDNEYDLIRASGLLRQMFIDKNSLFQVINRTYKTNISFQVINNQEPPIKPDTHIASLDPSKSQNIKTKNIPLNKFLQTKCSTHDNITVTVKDVIRACANIKGGIHLGQPKDNKDKEASVITVDEVFSILGKEPSLLLIKQICKISLKALIPLKNAIIKSKSS